MLKESEKIKLYNDDCIVILKQMIDNNTKVDAIICDIPYFNVVNESCDNQWKTEQDYLNWCEKVIVLCSKVLSDNGSILLFTGRQYNRKICNILDNYFIEKRIIIWSRKRNFNNTRGKALASGYEPICYYTKTDKGITFNNIKIKPKTDRKEYIDGVLKDGVTLSDVWSDISALHHNSKEKVNHPTQKPIKLMERCVEMITNENDVVLDFTMGSGTTGVACMNLNRCFVGIEIDKDYFDIAESRIKNILSEKNKKLL